MRHCPNPDCSHRALTGVAAEYEGDVAVCADCGGRLAPGEAPIVAKAARPAITGELWRRIAVSLAGALAPLGLATLPIPGVHAPVNMAIRDVGALSVVALGILPILSAFGLVELAALAVPSWRRARLGGPAGRARLGRATAILAVLLAAFQGWGIAMYVRAAGMTDSYGIGFVVETVLTLVAGTCVLALIAQAITRWGLGNGWSVMIAGAGLELAYRTALALTLVRYTVTPIAQMLLVVLEVSAMALTAWILVFGEREGERGTRAPLAGLAPIELAALVLWILGMLSPLPLDLSFTQRILGPLQRQDLMTQLIIVGGAGAVLSWLWARPAKIAAIRLRAGVANEAPGSGFTRAFLASQIWLFGLVAISIHVQKMARVGAFGDITIAVVVTAVAIDLAAEFRARRTLGEVVSVWPLHRLEEVAPTRALLVAAGIPAFARGAAHRSLLAFFGAWVPVEIFVPAQRAAEATALLQAKLATPTPRA